MPEPEVDSGGISLSKKGLLAERKKGGAGDELIRDRIGEKLEARLYAESAVQPGQMRLDRDWSDVELSSDILVAQALLEKLENSELGGRHQFCSAREIIRAHECDRVAGGPDLSALYDAKRFEQVRWIGSEQKVAGRAGAQDFSDRIEIALISGHQQIGIRKERLQMFDDREMKIDQKRMRDDHQIGSEVGRAKLERENLDRIIRSQETDFRIR